MATGGTPRLPPPVAAPAASNQRREDDVRFSLRELRSIEEPRVTEEEAVERAVEARIRAELAALVAWLLLR